MDTKGVLITGVGGQGILLASRVMASVLMESGYDVKVSEVHGMAQRGGDVHCMLRYGEQVASPLIGVGEADILMGFEQAEALRWLPRLRRDGHVVVNDLRILTTAMARGESEYPDVVNIIKEATRNLILIDATGLAIQAGSAKAVNIVLIGVVSWLFDLKEKVWAAHIEKNIPAKVLEINLEAFRLGRQAGRGQMDEC